MNLKHEVCTICYDENNNILDRAVCETCNFECCEKCYDNIESNACPICKSPHFKHYHNETISQQDVEFFEDIVTHLEHIIGQRYEAQIMVLLAVIKKLKKKNKQQSKLINEYESRLKINNNNSDNNSDEISDNNKCKHIECDCGKTVLKTSYKKHCESKFHKEHVSLHELM